MVGATGPLNGQVDDDGVEFEEEGSDAEDITQPFDPEKIKVRTVPLLVGQLVSRVKHSEIDLEPDFQRRAGIWSPQQESRLIESLLLRIPIPVFYVAADYDDRWSVVDGLQRTSAIHKYIAGELPLKGLQYLWRLNGRRYAELPRPMQRRIDETQLFVNVIEAETPEEVMFNIFHRINTGGLPLRGQEIRNAIHPGVVRNYLKEMAESDEFRIATCASISQRRMADQECVLRFLAFHMQPWEDYSANDLDGYLGDSMERINAASDEERNRLKADFKKALKAAHAIFGEDAFRKTRTDRRKPINRALFETWTVGLARRADDEIRCLVRQKDDVAARAKATLEDDRDFDMAISYSTGVPARVQRRFRTIEELIEGCLRC